MVTFMSIFTSSHPEFIFMSFCLLFPTWSWWWLRSPRFVTSCTLAFLRHEACEVVRIDNKGWCLSGELKEVPKTCCMSALTFFMDSKTFITQLYLEAFNIIQQQNKSGLCGSRKGWSAKFGSHSAEQGWTLLQGQGHLDDNLRIFTDQNYVLV